MAVRHPHGEPSDLIRSVSRALRVLESVGQAPRGLTVKQIARRCELTTATTYHLIRTLAYEGYVARREDGTYVVGLEIADRFRELVAAFAVRSAWVRRCVGRRRPRGTATIWAPSSGPGGACDRRRGTPLALSGRPRSGLRRRRARDRDGQGAAGHSHPGAAAAIPEGLGHAGVHGFHADPARCVGGGPDRGRAARDAGGDLAVSSRRRLCGGDGSGGSGAGERYVLACSMSADRFLDTASEVRVHLSNAARAVATALNSHEVAIGSSL